MSTEHKVNISECPLECLLTDGKDNRSDACIRETNCDHKELCRILSRREENMQTRSMPVQKGGHGCARRGKLTSQPYKIGCFRYTSFSSLCVSLLLLKQERRNIILLRAPIRSNTMGNPANVLVISNEIKYPASFGSVSPRMRRSC